MSLYTNEMKTLLHSSPAPYRGFVLDIVDYEYYLTLRVYRDNFDSYPKDQQQRLTIWLSELITAFKKESVVPIYLEVERTPPKIT